MFVVLRKKSVIICLVFVCAVILSCVMLSYAAGAEVASVPKIGKTVVVDAGHGGIDGGVVGSASGVKESEINLAIAKSLKHFLERNGYDVVMTRENSDGLYGLTSKNKKLRDMEARRDIIKEAKPDVVISVHQNYYPLSSVRGAQVFYSADSEISKQIADSMQGTLNTALGNDRIAKTGDYYIVNCTDFPSVIVECGFLSNPEEEKLLVTAAYQEKVAYSVFSAVHSIFGTETEHEHS